jgi:hypothetical protein
MTNVADRVAGMSGHGPINGGRPILHGRLKLDHSRMHISVGGTHLCLFLRQTRLECQQSITSRLMSLGSEVRFWFICLPFSYAINRIQSRTGDLAEGERTRERFTHFPRLTRMLPPRADNGLHA